MKNGICGLCKKQTLLRKSHLLPKSAYRSLRLPGANSRPTKIEIDRKRFVQTDKQIVAYFLCGGCEHIFSIRGEDAVSRVWARAGKFPLLDTLNLLTPIRTEGENSGYSNEEVGDSTVQALHYFAVSVVWRAIKWPGRDRSFKKEDVQISNESMMRVESYLKGVSDKLEGGLVLISVNTYPGLNDLISIPSMHAGSTFSYFEFYVLGMRFRVFLDFFDSLGLKEHDDGFNVKIITSDHGTEPLLQEAAKFFFENDIK